MLYRVAQEGLNNIAKHAEANRTDIKIQKIGGTICMEIKDNGKGFQIDGLIGSRRTKRLGFLGMRERLEMVGGSLTVASAPGKGTRVLARVPFSNRPRRGGGAVRR